MLKVNFWLHSILQYTVMQDYLSDVKLIIFNYFYVFYTNCELFQLLQNKLVNDDGVINTDAFYNYLTAWVSNDAMTYAASMADFHPLPSMWIHDSYNHYDFKSKLSLSCLFLLPL